MPLFNFVKKLFSEKNQPVEDISSEFDDMNDIDDVDDFDDLPEPLFADIPENVSDEDEMTLEDLLKDAVPSKNGLYPHEILMLYYAHSFTNQMEDNHFQEFWRYSYLVKNPASVLKSLEERGFIEPGDLYNTFETLTVKQLKAELKTIGAKVSGKKADLIVRLMNHGDIDALNKKYKKRHYTLTELGQKELIDNAYVPYLHDHPYVSIWDVNNVLAETANEHLSYQDCIWKVLNEECLYYINHSWYEKYESTRYKMAAFAMDEEKYELALSLLCEFFAYDLSGIRDWDFEESFNPKRKIKSLLEFFFTSDHRDFMITPYNLEWLKELLEKLSIPTEKVAEELQKIFDDIELPRRIFTNEECIQLILAEMNGDKEKSQQIQNQAKNRLKKELESLS